MAKSGKFGGTIDATAEYVNFGDVHGEAAGIFTFQTVSASFSGTLTPQASNDGGTTWATVAVLDLGSATSALATAITGSGIYRIDASGLGGFRVYATSVSSGSMGIHGYGSIG
jgi:hypothetical protein